MAFMSSTSSRLQPLLDEHAQLREAVRAIESDLVRQRGSVADIAANLTNLRDLLVAHFAEEESRGLFQLILEREPQAQAKVDALRQQHSEFVIALDELIGSAQKSSGDSWWENAGRAYTNFQEAFEQHEHAENDLLQNAFSDDIGTKD